MKGIWIKKTSDLNQTVVVFIHGILSSDKECWTHSNTTYWPKVLSESPQCKNFGIYSFEYRTGFFAGSYNLNDVVDALKEQLRIDEVLNCDSLIFVCHSMGGIVTRKYIVQNEVELKKQNKKYIGLFLLASPSLGTRYANWLKPIIRSLKNSQADTLRFEQNNIWLNGLDTDFIN